MLRRLNGDRKGALLRFLHEAKLIHKDRRVINLSGAYLRETDLSNADLSMADMSKADLVLLKEEYNYLGNQFLEIMV